MADQVQITLGANVANAINGLASFARSAQLATAAFVAGFATATKHAIDFADEMGKMAQKAGETTEEFSRLAYAGELAGVGVEALKTGFKGLSNAIKENGRVFDDLGINRFSNGGFRDASEVLGDIADKFQSMPDGVRKTTLAVQLFGRSGQDMIPMLNQGREGIQKLREESDALGVTISKEFAAKAEVFNDNMTRIGMGVKGLFLKIADEVLPSLNKATKSSVSVLMGLNKELEIYFKQVNELYRKVTGSSHLAGFSGMDKKIEATPGDSGIEFLNDEAAIRLRIQKNETYFADLSKRYDVSDEQKRRSEILYLEQKESLLKKLKLVIDPNADDVNYVLEQSQKVEFTKEEAEIQEKLLPVLREKAQITERLNRLKSNSFSDNLSEGLGKAAGNAYQFSARAAETLTSSVMTAVDGLSSAMQGLIEGTRNWGDVWRNVQSSILGMVLQLIIRFTVLFALVSALSFLFPGSSFVGRLAGFAGIPGKASGGVVGAGLYQVGEQGQEYVVNNKTLSRMGSAYFDSLQAGYTPPQAAGGGGSSNVHIGFIGGPAMVGQWLETREGRAYVANIADQQIREARG